MYDIKNLDIIPNEPGVYLMKDKLDNILYIGKAKNLNKRVKQYFNQKIVEKRGPKIIKMVELIENIEWIVTSTEVEALILENNLIKENKPKYNTLLIDDKTYPYIKITNEDYPCLEIVRKMENDGSLYYGPFTNNGLVKNVVELLKDIYKIRHCDYMNNQNNRCLYFQMNKCMGPCINNNSEYKENIEKIKKILNGNNNEINKKLKEKMIFLSNEMRFEEAAKYRDLIDGLKKITLKQNINNSFDSQDIIACSKTDKQAVVVIFFIRNGIMIDKNNFIFDVFDDNILCQFIQQYYSNVTQFPKEIIIGEEISDFNVLSLWLNGKTKIQYVQKGHKRSLYDLAKKNSDLLLNENLRKIETKKNRTTYEIKELENIIGSKINRIESFDISNTSGVLNVASMVVYENGNFKKQSYRKFKLNFIGADDYSCMKETIKRRFTDEKMKFYPDLLLIDGGKGQVNAVKEVLDELNINIKTCGMVKDDKHRTRGLYYNKKEYNIKDSISLVTRIQDETHRFAVEYHSLLRTKQMISSILEQIPGIGPKKRKSLLEYFGSVENIKKISKEELGKLNILSKKDIENIYLFFHND